VVGHYDRRHGLEPQASEEGLTLAHRQIALLRGINVGKANRVAMAALRAIVEELSCTNIARRSTERLFLAWCRMPNGLLLAKARCSR
jgi:hypothetical protein